MQIELTHPTRQFMAEHHNLELLERCRSEQQEHQLQNALNRDVADGHEHGASEHTRQGRQFTRTELRHPTGATTKVTGATQTAITRPHNPATSATMLNSMRNPRRLTTVP